MATVKNKGYPIENVYSNKVEEIAKFLDVNIETGLLESSIEERIKEYGLNSYGKQKQKSIWLGLFEQFKSPIILLLVIADGFFSSKIG